MTNLEQILAAAPSFEPGTEIPGEWVLVALKAGLKVDFRRRRGGVWIDVYPYDWTLDELASPLFRFRIAPEEVPNDQP